MKPTPTLLTDRTNLDAVQESLLNARGEQFKPGERVALLPDPTFAYNVKRLGTVRAVMRGRQGVVVEWDDYALLDVHIDRITHRRG